MNQFTDIEISNILSRKQFLEAHFQLWPTRKWFDTGLAIDWSKFYLSGGAIASVFHGEPPKDWDVYCSSQEEMHHVVKMLIEAKDYIADVNEKYREVLSKDGKMITENAITMNDGTSFIIRQYNSPSEMKKTFDYLHCTPHYNIVEKKLYISKPQYDAIVNKVLVLNNLDSWHQWREDKFLSRGYVKDKNV